MRSCVAKKNKTKICHVFFETSSIARSQKSWCTCWTLGKALDFVKKIPKIILAIRFSDQNQEKDVKLLGSSMIFLEELWQENRSPTYKESAPKPKS